ncbi:WD40-repeat-containing domain protein [Fimicolochytrium jonesii]|uniref:WD40-repeat-containing domain protein n=1 Tax=Fimicolochytrium jonesii TaxID=1396493 RepID=UPI0022FF1E8B|nr:WD40-repeat-containing domain protein [Fimicolochytrium jonesii]KAI8824821.1 WD40-repeat-containing domain protein [Fimicolochytrium jonesii]
MSLDRDDPYMDFIYPEEYIESALCEDVLVEVTAEDVRAGRVDMQGIDWSKLPIARERFRDSRVKNYGNFKNIPTVSPDILKREILKVRQDAQLYQFRHASLQNKCMYLHFQLRNLLWATSKNDVYYTNNLGVCHWCPISKTSRMALDLSKQDFVGMKISSIVAKKGYLMVGGFSGEYMLRRLTDESPPTKGSLTTDSNGFTNHLDIEEARSGALSAIASSNDQRMRMMDLASAQIAKSFYFDTPVNCAALSPDKRMLCVVGDDPETIIVDSERGRHLATLTGHLDYSFACAWSPCGRVLATGNQDMTTRIYDTRNMSQTLSVLSGRMGAIRSIRFSDDARFMAFAEPADFVHIVDMTRLPEGPIESWQPVSDAAPLPRSASSHRLRTPGSTDLHDTEDEDGDAEEKEPTAVGFMQRPPGEIYRSQVVDFFGEIAGISFNPGGNGDGADELFIGIADSKYGSILELQRDRDTFYRWTAVSNSQPSYDSYDPEVLL